MVGYGFLLAYELCLWFVCLWDGLINRERILLLVRRTPWKFTFMNSSVNRLTFAEFSWRPLRFTSFHAKLHHFEDMLYRSLFDVIAQIMNCNGAKLAGPTIFAIVYSSVTIWAALYKPLLLYRNMNSSQWLGVLGVFLGFDWSCCRCYCRWRWYRWWTAIQCIADFFL